MAKKPKKPTSDPRSPYDVFKPEKKKYYKQLPIPGLIYPLAKRNKKSPTNGVNEAWHTTTTKIRNGIQQRSLTED